MSSPCPSFTFSCSNISCSIWFCCGGSDSTKEHEQDPKIQHQPPSSQVITVPDHLKQTTTTGQQPPAPPPPPAGQQPPAPPPPTRQQSPAPPPPPAGQQPRAPPPPALEPVRVHVRPSPPPTIPLHVPSTGTYYPAPQTTQQRTWPQTLPPPALPPSLPATPKVHDLWPPSTQLTPSHVQSTMMPKAPPQPAPLAPLQAPWPPRQPSKTYQAPPLENKEHLVPPHLQFKNYQDDALAVAPPKAFPPGSLVDSNPFMGYYPQEHQEYFVQGS